MKTALLRALAAHDARTSDAAPDYRRVFANMTPEQATAVYMAAAQWAENERCRDDVDESEVDTVSPHLVAVESVVDACNMQLAQLAEVPQ